MKKFIALLMMLCCVCTVSAEAQILKGIADKAKNAAKNAVNNKVSQKVFTGVNKAVDKASDAIENAAANVAEKAADKAEQRAQERAERKAAEEAEYSGGEDWESINHNRMVQNRSLKYDNWDTGYNALSEADDEGFIQAGPAGKVNGPKADVRDQKPLNAEYAKSDFVPGNEIFFEDPVEGETVGEFPSKWDLLEGNCEIATVNGQQAIPLIDSRTRITPLFDDNSNNYLPDVYTFEVDVWGTVFGDGADVSEAKYIFSFMDENRSQVYRMFLYLKGEKESEFGGDWRNGSTGETSSNSINAEQFIKKNDWNHLALSFNKRALKMYINGHRVINVPNAKKAGCFNISNDLWETLGFIKNIRIAKGAVPLYDRLSSNGKIVTYAITFDTGKATLKPEADLEINRIKGLMDEHPDLKFEVQGHCDNTGSAEVNDKLSQQRAEVIVSRLVHLGVSADRLSAAGKGSRVPIADNGTDEGKAKNRRVEFVKK